VVQDPSWISVMVEGSVTLMSLEYPLKVSLGMTLYACVSKGARGHTHTV